MSHTRGMSSIALPPRVYKNLRTLLTKISKIKITTGTLLTSDIEPFLIQQITSLNRLFLETDPARKLTWRQTKQVIPMLTTVSSLIKFYSLLVNFAGTQHGTFRSSDEYRTCAALKTLANKLTEQSAAAIKEKNRINLLIRDIHDATYKDPSLSPAVSKKADLLLETIRNSPDVNLLDEVTGFDDSMHDELQAITARDTSIRGVWEACIKQVFTSKVLLDIVPTLTDKFQKSQELQDELTEYSAAVENARKMTSHYELTNFRQAFYSWHEITHTTKIAPLRIFFDLVDNFDSCLMSQALNATLSERMKNLVEQHASVIPSSLKPNPLLAQIYKTTKAFDEFECSYPEIKKALKFNEKNKHVISKNKGTTVDGESSAEEITMTQEKETSTSQLEKSATTESSTSKVTSLIKKFEEEAKQNKPEEPEPIKKQRPRASSISADDTTLATSAPRVDQRMYMQRMLTTSKLTTHYRPTHPKPLNASSLPTVPQNGVLEIEKVRTLSSSLGKK